MPRHRLHTTFTIGMTALTALTTLTACSGHGSTSQPTPSTSSSAAPATPTTNPTGQISGPQATPRALKAAAPVMASTTLPTAAATLPFTIQTFGHSDRNAVLSIVSVDSTPTGTTLKFWTNTTPDRDSVPPNALSSGYPELYPTLTDATKKTYKVDTFVSDTDGNGKPEYTCICSTGGFVGPNGQYLMEASYPTLPDSVTTVDVTLPGAKGSVSVPVTR